MTELRYSDFKLHPVIEPFYKIVSKECGLKDLPVSSSLPLPDPDAKKLQFLDGVFSTVTSFFTLMYLAKQDRTKLFQETYRVLKQGGQFLLWDVIIPPRHEEIKDIFVIPLEITLPNEKVITSYGVLWEDREQNILYYECLAKEVGFKVVTKKQEDQVFYLELLKN